MHNYLRMYWGKKILEWSPTPKEAFNRCLALNTPIRWTGATPRLCRGCLVLRQQTGLAERAIFGNIRYMNDKGLERKFNMKGYLARIEQEIALRNQLS
jgi:deoxyribodipyrimidine photo-lyase